MIKTLPYPILIVVLILSVVSCSQDSDNLLSPIVSMVPAIVEFNKTEISFNENDGEKIISLILNKPVIKNGIISISLSSQQLSQFEFTPAAENGIIQLPISKNESSASFKILLSDNTVMDGDKEVHFSISAVTNGIKVGTKKELSSKWIDDESPALVDLAANALAVKETNQAGAAILISFSHKAPGDGNITIALASDHGTYGTHYSTIPAAIDGRITLSIPAGSENISFKIVPLDNTLFNPNIKLTYNIAEATGAVAKGSRLLQEIEITDDELNGKPKGYSSQVGGWGIKRTYSYNENGSVASIYWEQHTPFLTSGTDQYVYDVTGKLEKIIESPSIYTSFTWEQDRILKSHRYTNGILKKFIVYGYDPVGNVGEVSIYNLQPDDTFMKTQVLSYLYHNDRNVYKKMSYAPVGESQNLVRISTETYENYLIDENPFPLEILPLQSIQNKLPSIYIVENANQTLNYNFHYSFSSEGQLKSRTASASGVSSETVVYEFY